MHLIANSIQPNDVREETRNGDQYYVVEDVPFVKPMRLAGGYVPEDSIKDATPDWDQTPLTANHPRNKPQKPWYRSNVEDNAPISVNTSEAVRREYVIGQAENPRWDGKWTRADLAVNATVANAMGGPASDIVSKIEAGEQFDVSSQYLPEQLPSGEYDGEHRANAEAIADTDSIALLPHKPGKCSIEEGCGINPSGVSANAADLQGVRVPTMADDPSGEDGGFPETMQDNLDDSDPESVGRRVLRALGITANEGGGGMESETDEDEQGGNEEAESSTDDDSTNMSDKTAELVANHGFNEDNLPPEDTECFDRIYEAVTSNDNEDDETEEEQTANNEYVTEGQLDDKLDSLKDDVVEAVSANNKESEKDSLAETIVANSAEYDDTEQVKGDYPTKTALETKAEQVSGNSSVLPGRGQSGQVANSGDSLDEYSDGSI